MCTLYANPVVSCPLSPVPTHITDFFFLLSLRTPIQIPTGQRRARWAHTAILEQRICYHASKMKLGV